jgi:hypothetical protein
VTATGLTADLSAHALHTAPTTLAASIASAVSGIPSALLPATVTLAMSTVQKSFLAAGLAVALGGGVYEAIVFRAYAAELKNLRSRSEQVAGQIRETRREHDSAMRRLEAATHRPVVVPVSPSASDLALEGQVNAWRQRVARIRQLRDERPDLGIPELQLLNEDQWYQAARDAHFDTDNQIRDAFAALRRSAEQMLVKPIQSALADYVAAHGDRLPTTTDELAPYFTPPIDPAVLRRYEIAATGKLSEITSRQSNRIVVLRNPVDLERDTLLDIGMSGSATRDALGHFVGEARRAYMKANPGSRPTDPSHLAPFLPGAVSPEKLRPFLK